MIVIPMAGKSSRFYNAGYKIPKFMLPLGVSTNVFSEAVNSFKAYFKEETFLFITRLDDRAPEFVKKECKKLGIESFEIVSLNKDTRGQAETVMQGILELNDEQKKEPLYIFNIDSIRINFKKPSSHFLSNTSGYLEVFKGEGEHWSFAEPIDSSRVKRTTEKIRISDFCSNGLYYFSSSELFQETFRDLELSNDYKELFIAPMYNIIIGKGLTAKYVLLRNNQTLFSGTPLEYTALKKQLNY